MRIILSTLTGAPLMAFSIFGFLAAGEVSGSEQLAYRAAYVGLFCFSFAVISSPWWTTRRPGRPSTDVSRD